MLVELLCPPNTHIHVFIVFYIRKKLKVCSPTGMRTNRPAWRSTGFEVFLRFALGCSPFWPLLNHISLIVFTVLQRELCHWSDVILIGTILAGGCLSKKKKKTRDTCAWMRTHTYSRCSCARNPLQAFLWTDIGHCAFHLFGMRWKGTKAMLVNFLRVLKRS